VAFEVTHHKRQPGEYPGRTGDPINSAIHLAPTWTTQWLILGNAGVLETIGGALPKTSLLVDTSASLVVDDRKWR
jgi:hypothetical protein